MMIHTVNIFFTNPEELLMKIAELAGAIAGVSAQITKVQEEILGEIFNLEAALNDVDVPEEAADALVALRLGVQALDDIVPDPEIPVE